MSDEGETGEKSKTPVPKPNREIRGNLPYLASPGAISKVLAALIDAERPDKFTVNYLETVLGLTGGANRAVPPFLKKMGFLSSDASPTDRYARFKTESGRQQAAYDGLKDAYAELFRKNEVVHRADEKKVKDLIVEITGLNYSDNIVRLMYNCFDAIRTFIPSGFSSVSAKGIEVTHGKEVESGSADLNVDSSRAGTSPIGLSYHINLVLPETENQAVLDAIFRSIKRNLL